MPDTHSHDARRTAELVGMCRGVVADQRLNLIEARYLHQWMGRHPEVLDTAEAAMLLDALERCIADGVLSAEEEAQIVRSLVRFADAATPETAAEAA